MGSRESNWYVKGWAYCKQIVKEQRTCLKGNGTGLVANLLILLSLTHLCFPRLRSFTKLFFSLAYYNPSSQSYGRGRDDLYHVVFWVLIFTGIRALAMQQILSPFARWAGIRKEKARVRFSEQAWLLIYYTCSWSVGVVSSPRLACVDRSVIFKEETKGSNLRRSTSQVTLITGSPQGNYGLNFHNCKYQDWSSDIFWYSTHSGYNKYSLSI